MPDLKTEAPVAEVAADVFRVAVPVPFRGLGAVNAYLLRADDGWDLVDTGMKTPEALAAWQAAFADLGLGAADLRQIVLTHHHPDHTGLAGFFQQAARRAGRVVPVRLSAREIEIVGIVWGDRRARDAEMEAFLAACGVPDAAAANFRAAEIQGIRQMIEPFPEDIDVVAPGETFGLGRRRVVALHTPGHSDGHLAFFDEAGGLLLAGDHVLPHITPNIARWPGVEPDPLGRYLASLAELKTLPVRRALPGHGPPLDAWAGRLDALIGHHEARLAEMYAAVGAGATAYDVTRRVFRPGLNRHEFRMALVETLAHLEHLVARGRLARRDGPPWQFVPV